MERSNALAAVFVGLFLASALVLWWVAAQPGEPLPPDAASPTDPAAVPDPVADGEPLPAGYRVVFDRDGIPPIYDPAFVEADEAGWEPETLVVGVALEGEARAYPVNVLNRREIVNDWFGDVPVLVTWCPLCGTAMAHERAIDGEPVVFGNQGDLFGNAMTWWDHGTGSVWTQPLGEALVGPLAGARLDLLPSQLTTWSSWRDRHPGTLALDAPGGPTSFRLEDTVITVEFGDRAVGYPVTDLQDVGVVVDEVGGVPIAVVSDPDDPQQWVVLSRRLDDRAVDLVLDGGRLVDPDTGTAWDPVRGLGLDGPLAEQRLDVLPAFTLFPDDFWTFFPDGDLWRP